MNNENQPLNSDYLNQISTKPASKADFFKQKPVMIGAICLAVFVIIIIISLIVGALNNNGSPTKHLAAKLQSTEEVVGLAAPNIKNTKLRALNSNLKIYLTNTIRDYTVILTKNNINIDKLDASVTKSESNTKILATLEDARLNAIYDRTYAREMSYQLDKILSLMKQLYNSSSSKATKDFLDNAHNSLSPTQKQFADFNAANG